MNKLKAVASTLAFWLVFTVGLCHTLLALRDSFVRLF